MARDRASRPEAKPLRLFVAVEIPQEVRDLVASALSPWRARYPRAKWVPVQNQHVTVRFLGSTWPRFLGWVEEAIAEAATGTPGFESRIEGVGAFPSDRRARVLWVGISDADGYLAALAERLDAVLAREFRREERAFMPHLTVARFDPPVPLDGLADVSLVSEPFSVERLTLFRSHLRRPAPVYEPLVAVPLSG